MKEKQMEGKREREREEGRGERTSAQCTVHL